MIVTHLLRVLLFFYFITILISILKKRNVLFQISFYIGLVIIFITVYNNLLILNGTVKPLLCLCIGLISYIIAVSVFNFTINLDSIKCIYKIENYLYCKVDILKTIVASIYEELFWRGSIFYIISSHEAIIVLSFLFSTLHIGKKITIREFMELTFFSLIEFIILIYTQNILNCIIVHAIRNTFIILLNFEITQKKRGEE